MRVLLDTCVLDNCVPWRPGKALTGHDVASVITLGWADLTNGHLLAAMDGQFDVLVTVDEGIRHQQRLDDRPVAVLLLRARSNRLADLLPLVPALLHALGEVKAGEVREIGSD